jgi:hypothetical protein
MSVSGGWASPARGAVGPPRSRRGVSRRAAEAAGQLTDPVDRSIRRPSAQIPIRSDDFPSWIEGVSADDHRRSSVTLPPRARGASPPPRRSRPTLSRERIEESTRAACGQSVSPSRSGVQSAR